MSGFEIFTVMVVGYIMFLWGKSIEKTKRGQFFVDNALARTVIPVLVGEEIEGHFYLYEKDTQNFICQTDSLDNLPQKLYDAKKITLALILFPEIAMNKKYWCINGKIKLVE